MGDVAAVVVPTKKTVDEMVDYLNENYPPPPSPHSQERGEDGDDEGHHLRWTGTYEDKVELREKRYTLWSKPIKININIYFLGRYDYWEAYLYVDGRRLVNAEVGGNIEGDNWKDFLDQSFDRASKEIDRVFDERYKAVKECWKWKQILKERT